MDASSIRSDRMGEAAQAQAPLRPTNSVLLVDVDADANHTAIVAIVMIPAGIMVVAIVAIPASVVVIAVAGIPHADLLEVIANERESARDGRPVLDERQGAYERSTAAA